MDIFAQPGYALHGKVTSQWTLRGRVRKKKIATTKTISGIQLQQTKNTQLVYREGSPTLPMLFTSPLFTFFTSLMQDAQKKSHNKK